MHHSGVANPVPRSPGALTFVSEARTATLATITPAGRARLVPVCFVVIPENAQSPLLVYSPLDEKPKSVADVRGLGRVRDIAANPEVTILIDRWSEDWDRLGWVRLEGRAMLLEPTAAAVAAAASEHAVVVAALRAKYPQYAEHALESLPMIRIAVDRVASWGNLAG